MHRSQSVAYLVSVVNKRELWKPWANDPESFERAVLADLERRVSQPHAAYLMREPAGREFREARLDGSFPKTAIVVSFLNLHTRSVRSRGSLCGRRRDIAQARV
jgi:hypothetical protein